MRIVWIVFLLAFFCPNLFAANLYWVGAGGASTNTASNWKTTDPAACGGGDSGAAPQPGDNIFFDADCDNNAAIDAALSVDDITISSGYSGTVTQSATITLADDFTQNAGTFTGGSQAITIAGDVTLTAGTFTSTSGTLSIAGDWNDVGATFAANSGTIDFTKTAGTQTLTTLGSQTYGTIKGSGAGTLSVVMWRKRRLITIDRTQVSAVADPTVTYANFPVLVSLTGLSNINANGTDIRFTSSDGKTLLPREIERYSSGTLVAWVKMTLTKDAGDGSNDTFYMYYHNTTATEPAATDTYGSQNVWNSNFKAVYHLGDAGPNTAADSTSNANTGTQTNSVTFGATGEIGNATSYVRTSSQYIKINDANSLDFGTGAFTTSIWFKTSDTTNAAAIASKLEGTTPSTRTDDYWALIKNAAGSITFRLFDFGTNTSYNATTTATTYDDNAWHYIVGVRVDASNSKVYLDGNVEIVSLATVANVNVTTDGVNSIGAFVYIGAPDAAVSPITATLDEHRISGVEHSAQWILTEYNNQKPSSTFISAGSETSNDFTKAAHPRAGDHFKWFL